MRTELGLAILLSMISGCGADEAQPLQAPCPAGQEVSKVECETAGGHIVVAYRNREICNCPTQDAYKPCMHYDECEVACVADADSGEARTASLQGHCAAYTPGAGCVCVWGDEKLYLCE